MWNTSWRVTVVYRATPTKTLKIYLNGHPKIDKENPEKFYEVISFNSSAESIEGWVLGFIRFSNFYEFLPFRLKKEWAKAVKRKYSDSSRVFYLKDGTELDDYDLIFLKDEEELWFSHKGEDFSYKQILSKYTTVSKLGQGGFGKVYLVEEKETNVKYAIKYIDISFFMSKADLVKEIFRESKTLSVLQHKNIITLHRTFLHKNDIVLIMEYAPDGELKKYVLENGGVSEIGKLPKTFISPRNFTEFLHF